MVELRYHVVSLIAVFLALGLGILIGSTIVRDNLIAEQQIKMIDRLEDQFYILRERESQLISENEYFKQVINNYENYSQVLLPAIVHEKLRGQKVGIVVTGGKEMPAGLLNALSISGAEVISQTVILANIGLQEDNIKEKVSSYYGVEDDNDTDLLRRHIARSVAYIVSAEAESGNALFLQENNLVKMNGSYDQVPDGIVIIGGADNISTYFPEDFDMPFIEQLINLDKRVFAVENADITLPYMEFYQGFNITTVDNIDYSPGQISLILAMEGEPGDYGVKATAKRFMPSIPLDYLRGQTP